MQIAIISCSPRVNSNSLRFSKYLQSLAKNSNIDAEIVDFHHFDIPNVGRGNLKAEELSTFQAKLIGDWAKANLVILVNPEYNWSVNGDVLTALHQLGSKNFEHLFNNKTFALVGVSAGRGGKVPCLELTTVINKVISFTNQNSVVSPRIYESHETPNNLTPEGQSTGNQIYETTVKSFFDYSINVAERWGRGGTQ